MMYHEATACHVTADMVDLLAIVQDLLKTARTNRESIELRQWLAAWKDQPDVMRKLLTLLNSFTPPDLRQICIGKNLLIYIFDLCSLSVFLKYKLKTKNLLF